MGSEENRLQILKRIKRILGILAVNAVIMTVGILILELAFGGWLDSKRLNRLNLLRDCRLEYDVSGLYETPNPIIRHSRDKYGLRGNYSDPASIDILTVGGSTTDQRFIRDGETWQDVLEQQFARQGAIVVVANAGVSGQSTYGHIKDFEWWFPSIPNLAPRFILFYVGLNDFYKDERHSLDDLYWDNNNVILQSIKFNSAVYHLFRTLRGAYWAMIVSKVSDRSIDFKKMRWSTKCLQDNYEFMQPRLNAYADRLRTLANMTRAFGAKPIFVSQPARQYRITAAGIEGLEDTFFYDGYQYNGVDYYHMMKRLDSVTKTVAMEKNAQFVDLSASTAWNDADFYDQMHMTPQGVAKVGTLLYSAIKDIIVDPKSQNRPGVHR